MKWHSFRLRITLLSAILAGSALVGFGFVSWFLIYQTKLARLDDQIKSHLLRESSAPRPLDHWESYELALPSFFGVDSQAKIALLVLDVDGNILFQSTNWPSDLDRSGLFPPQDTFRPPPRFRPPRQRPPYPYPPPREGEEFPPPGPPPEPPEEGLFPPPEPRREPPEEGLFPPPEPRREPPEEGLFPPPEPRREPPPFRPHKPINQLSPLVKRHTVTGIWRVGGATSPFIQIAIAVSFTEFEHEMSAISNIFLISVPSVLIVVAIAAWFLSERALKPIREVTATLQRVTAKGLDQRIPISAVDVEFLEQIKVFNQMMERLERSFQQASRFSADAAHELKTPLAILQGELERTLQQADSGSELQQNLSNLLDEVGRLGSIVRKLLLLSLADAGQMRLHKVEIDLSALLLTLAEDIELLAPDLSVNLQIQPGLRVKGDRDLLIQVLQNLITNAVKYNLPSGWVRIEAKLKELMVSVTVTNSSHDIPVSDRERIFNRFHRGDSAHNRHIEGLGLGLSLSREIARAHGGELILDSTPIGQTAFTLRLTGFRGR
ncbi:ATP-binding protein [Kamptonema sp. UHCC 0994]|uniref:sensor histidine kinase n=1 Tax=Kamptonema sp. UHCC 0994 TaxID=3031329 RepID=UPI0023B95521|nr:ATP-binding protein [Kamptonema sp. UHCC 0994]MDF0552761.1 ATP-binding protein [Kamptonema sp. UHCC 0994]